VIHGSRPAAREPADGTLVLLHGRATDEHDLLPVIDALDPERRLDGLTPRGPFALPPGGHHWYGPVVRVGFPNKETFEQSFTLLSEWLDATVDLERTVLGGFSQGAVMAYALGLGRGRPTPAGIVALSGFIPTVGGWEAELQRPALPVWIAHGRRDPVISIDFARAAHELLEGAGLSVAYHESEAGHHVDPRALTQLPAWVRAAVTRNRASAAS
jgi:phospholipase/carboxylesterase